jgi:hypothetical protein
MKRIIILIIIILIIANIPTALCDEVKVYFSPPSLEVKPGQEFTVKICADPGGKGISAGEVNVIFNPDVLECIDIGSGDILGPSPLVGVKKIDNVNGSLRFAIARIGRTEPPTQPGVFAEIRFKAKPEANIGTYTIELVGIGLADEKFNDITDISIDDGSVEVRVQVQQLLEVDVWTNKGGRGIGNPNGGRYFIGESIILYCSINIAVNNLKVIITMPDGREVIIADKECYPPLPAGTYIIGTYNAREPVGEWSVEFKARSGDQISHDMVYFTSVMETVTTTTPQAFKMTLFMMLFMAAIIIAVIVLVISLIALKKRVG